MSTAKLFNKEQRNAIVNAIIAAEKETSGEIRVHIERACRGNVMERAAWWFRKLRMDKTRARNGVLIYVALRSSRFAIIGDVGINEVVPEGFWDGLSAQMQQTFTAGKFMDGIIFSIAETGRLLKQYFPYTADDINERPDNVSFGD